MPSYFLPQVTPIQARQRPSTVIGSQLDNLKPMGPSMLGGTTLTDSGEINCGREFQIAAESVCHFHLCGAPAFRLE